LDNKKLTEITPEVILVKNDMSFNIKSVSEWGGSDKWPKQKINYDSALEALEDNRTIDFRLSEDNKELVIIEKCDGCFGFFIKKKDFLVFKNILNMELNKIYDKMVE